MHPRLTLIAAAAAFFAAATAQLSIVVPGGPNLWWVASAENNIVWTCQTSPYQNFTILVANQNTQILSAPIAIVAIENNYDCSKIITPLQANQPVGTGYMVQFANTLNQSDIYAQSQPFEIKAAGSTYPASSATPTATGTSTTSGTAAGGAATNTPSKSAAATNVKWPVAGLGLAAAGALLGLVA